MGRRWCAGIGVGRKVGMERPRARRERKCRKIVPYVLSYEDIAAHGKSVQLGEDGYSREKTSCE